MLRLYLIITVIVGCSGMFVSCAGSPRNDADFYEVFVMGGVGETHGDAVAVGPDGVVFVAGNFRGSLEFDAETTPGGQALDITRCFVARLNEVYDPSDVYVWGSWSVADLVVDADGAVYVVSLLGQSGQIIADDASSIVTPTGDTDLLIMKLSPNLTVEWYSPIGGNLEDYFGAVALDESGHVYVAGSTRGASPLSALPGLPEGEMNVDSFVMKLGGNGDLMWRLDLSGPGKVVIDDLAVDSSGNVTTSGHFSEEFRFTDSGGEETYESVGGTDGFLFQADSEGQRSWLQVWGGSGYVTDCNLAIAPVEDIYVAGKFGNAVVDFDPGPGVANSEASGNGDCFVSRFNREGQYQWTAFYGDMDDERCTSVVVDSRGWAYLGGVISPTGLPLGVQESFLCAVNAEGRTVMEETWEAWDMSDMCVDAMEHLYVIGSFSDRTDFCLGGDHLIRQGDETSDIYLLVVRDTERLTN